MALNTWVANLPKDPYQRMLGNKESDGVGIGVVLRDAKWRRFTTKDYLAQSKSIHRLQNNLELRILLTYLIPTAHGIYADLDSQFVAGMRVGDVITKYESNPTMRKLFELNSRIKKNPNSKIHKSNYDIYKTYLSTLNSILRERDGIMPNLQTEKLSYFHKTFLEKRLLTEGDSYYQDGIGACRDWFKDKIGVGGNVPVGVWETLPPFGEKLSKKIEQELLKK